MPRIVPETPDGSPEAVLEELDERDGPPAEPPADMEPPALIAQPSVNAAPPPLEPTPPPDGYGAHDIVPAEALGPQVAAVPGAVMAESPADPPGPLHDHVPDTHAELAVAEPVIADAATPGSPSSAPAAPAPWLPLDPQTPAAQPMD